MQNTIEGPDLSQPAVSSPAEVSIPDAIADLKPGKAVVDLSKQAIYPVGLLIGLIMLMHMTAIPIKNLFTVLWSAILLAATIAPAATYIQNRFRIARWLTTLGIYAVVLSLLAGAVALVIPLAVHEIRLLSHELPKYIENLKPLLVKFAPQQAERFTIDNLAQELSGKLAGLADILGSTIGTILAGSFKLLLILFMALFMVSDSHLVEPTVRRFFPKKYGSMVLGAMSDSGERISKWARAQLLLALFFGSTFGLGLLIIHNPYWLTFAVAGAVLEIIPYVGGAVTLFLALLVAATQGSMWQVVATAAIYFVVVEIQGHVLAPKLMDRFLHMRPIIVILALFLGEETLGILGTLFGIPLAIVVLELLNQFFPAPSQPAEVAAVGEAVQGRGLFARLAAKLKIR